MWHKTQSLTTIRRIMPTITSVAITPPHGSQLESCLCVTFSESTWTDPRKLSSWADPQPQKLIRFVLRMVKTLSAHGVYHSELLSIDRSLFLPINCLSLRAGVLDYNLWVERTLAYHFRKGLKPWKNCLTFEEKLPIFARTYITCRSGKILWNSFETLQKSENFNNKSENYKILPVASNTKHFVV